MNEKIVYLEESDILRSDKESKFGHWAIDFTTKVGDKFCLRRPRFSELRPYSLFNS
jgi:hypothetical protein